MPKPFDRKLAASISELAWQRGSNAIHRRLQELAKQAYQSRAWGKRLVIGAKCQENESFFARAIQYNLVRRVKLERKARYWLK